VQSWTKVYLLVAMCVMSSVEEHPMEGSSYFLATSEQVHQRLGLPS
jgi:hypothetical protein